ncbi:MAG: hypothetical protein IJV69_07550 [Kiritimatiellae bacterium]|nr:hypothetical protein [Kiritimatiellia bacterium]
MLKFIIPILLFGCGCQSSIFATRALHEWAQTEFTPQTELPFSQSRKLVLGRKTAIHVILTATQADQLMIDCGFGLRVKLKDPQYKDGWATLTLCDVNQDDIDDLMFMAQFTDQPRPFRVVFILEPTGWTQYLLPDFQD